MHNNLNFGPIGSNFGASRKQNQTRTGTLKIIVLLTKLANRSSLKKGYNDINVLYDPEVYQKLIDGGVDHLMAQHVAHLFIRQELILCHVSDYWDLISEGLRVKM